MNFLRCPICGESLVFQNGGYQCEHHHNFDCAKSGYVNLLTVTQKNSKLPGDNKLMAAARRDFLNKRYYEPLSEALNELCISLIAGKEHVTILDAGCGEGYYTNRLFSALSDRQIQLIGIDISKFALDFAAKRFAKDAINRSVSLAAASVFHLPVLSRSFDLALNLFAPMSLDEYRRVLKPGGFLILIIPGENHLWELKQAVYDVPYKNEPKDTALEGFSLICNSNVNNKITLNNANDIRHLFEMTPYYYKTSAGDQSRLFALEHLTVQTEFEILCYQII